GHGVCHQSGAHRGALPPRGPRRWFSGRLRGRPGSEKHPAGPGAGRMNSAGTARREAARAPGPDAIDRADWKSISAELDELGGALLPRLLTDPECVAIRNLYSDQAGVFRSTINLGRHRFGEGEYRYFETPYPEPVERLKQALYPHLVPIARDWWEKLARPAPWPDSLDEWLARCHHAGQTRSTALLL